MSKIKRKANLSSVIWMGVIFKRPVLTSYLQWPLYSQKSGVHLEFHNSSFLLEERGHIFCCCCKIWNSLETETHKNHLNCPRAIYNFSLESMGDWFWDLICIWHPQTLKPLPQKHMHCFRMTSSPYPPANTREPGAVRSCSLSTWGIARLRNSLG